jgi:hypothetical protein
MKVISFSQYKRGDTAGAEETMRKAIRMIELQWGTQHSWILEFKNVLEGWLRERGKVGAANVLREEIRNSMLPTYEEENEEVVG